MSKHCLTRRSIKMKSPCLQRDVLAKILRASLSRIPRPWKSAGRSFALTRANSTPKVSGCWSGECPTTSQMRVRISPLTQAALAILFSVAFLHLIATMTVTRLRHPRSPFGHPPGPRLCARCVKLAFKVTRDADGDNIQYRFHPCVRPEDSAERLPFGIYKGPAPLAAIHYDVGYLIRRDRGLR